MHTKDWTLAQEKAALQLRCEVVRNQLDKISRIVLAEVSDIRRHLMQINELETEVAKWQFELQQEENQLKSQPRS